ncbi:MAG TPA: alanine--tRNA ligase [Thermoleophilaceae bacterium]|nr:alanine--tRNA ligase [Thermoleophilaceae bacterium]
MKAAEIRERYLSFFEARGHRRMPSASLVPASYDPSVLLTTAGMQPLKPYFRGEEQPPAPRLTSCQKCFRTTDIENVGLTARHLTFFEMLGNFSIGDYFKREAIELAWELSTSADGYGFDPAQVWVTVFGGDSELALEEDAEAIAFWQAIGVPDERIVRLGRDDNFWQAGPSGPCGPCSELYLDRGLDFGGSDDRPGDDSERFLEFWNLVFMQYELHGDGSLTELPQRNIDTGMGLDRMAAILQDVPSVYETEHFRPLVEFGERRSGRSYGDDFATTRALRVLADHGRAATFLIADGVVPSNEDRGYILRRILRRAIHQGRVLGIEQGFLPELCDVVVDSLGEVYGELRAERETIRRWASAEEAGFGRTLANGQRLLDELIAAAREQNAGEIAAADAFKLHDTYGFPFELTQELLAEQALAVDVAGFEALMDEARATARAGARDTDGGDAERVAELVRGAGFQTNFVGYERTDAETVARSVQRLNGTLLVKLEDSPFYPQGGGQVSDSGFVTTPTARARVVDVVRVGGDQALALEPVEGEIAVGDAVHAVVERDERLATMRNHTATHLLHAALRERLGTHVRQAGSYVGPDKLRFDFTHGERLSADDLQAVERRVNGWIAAGLAVRAIETTLDEARRLGAMALFGEKYGDWVRMVEVAGVSRELCGGTHVASTAEIGLFHVTTETSSASNVRRIEAVTGPVATGLFEQRTARLRELSALLKAPEADLVRAAERAIERSKPAKQRPAGGDDGAELEALMAGAQEVDGIQVVTALSSTAADAKALLALSDRVAQKLGDAVVVLGADLDGKVHLVVQSTPAAVARGVKAGAVVRAAAEVVGGGGGGRDSMAQAGGRHPERLDDALTTAAERVAEALRSAE